MGESVAEHNADLLAREGAGVKLEFRVLYNQFSTSYRGLYFGGFWRQDDTAYHQATIVRQAEDARTQEDVVLVQRISGVVGVEAGYSASLPWEIWGKKIQVRVGLGGPLARSTEDSPDDGLRYRFFPNWAELRVSVQVPLKSLMARRHPLGAR